MGGTQLPCWDSGKQAPKPGVRDWDSTLVPRHQKFQTCVHNLGPAWEPSQALRVSSCDGGAPVWLGPLVLALWEASDVPTACDWALPPPAPAVSKPGPLLWFSWHFPKA